MKDGDQNNVGARDSAGTRGFSSHRVEDSEAGMRLDRWLKARVPGLPYSLAHKLIRCRKLRVGGARAAAALRLQPGMVITWPPGALPAKAETRPAVAVPETWARRLRAAVLYEDESLIALNKPSGLACQGGRGITTALDQLAAVFADNGETPRLVHRLDKETSGIILLAKDRASASKLASAFARRAVRKSYWAAVHGRPPQRHGEITMAVAARSRKGAHQTPLRADDSAKTAYRLLACWNAQISWLLFSPQSGRKHQLRAHAAALGCPILGDRLYGNPAPPGNDRPKDLPPIAPRLHLHARSLAFPHPKDGTTLRINADLPPELARLWHECHFHEKDGDGWEA